MKYYLCKFIPPRPDFLATMSDDELKLMKRHGAFLDELFAQGVIVALVAMVSPSTKFRTRMTLPLSPHKIPSCKTASVTTSTTSCCV